MPFSILSISPTHHVFHAPFTTALSLLLIITRIAAFPAELFQPIVTLGLTDPAINGTDAAGAANWTVLESLLFAGAGSIFLPAAVTFDADINWKATPTPADARPRAQQLSIEVLPTPTIASVHPLLTASPC